MHRMLIVCFIADHISAAFVSVNSSTRLIRANPSELAEMKEPP